MVTENRTATVARRLVNAISIAVISFFVLLPPVLAYFCLEQSIESYAIVGIAALVGGVLVLLFVLGPFHTSSGVLVGLSGTNGIGAAVIIAIVAVVDVVNQGYAIAGVVAFILSALLTLFASALPEHVYENRVGDAIVAVALSYMTYAMFFVLVSVVGLVGGGS